MYFKRIEIQGFKSFADPVTIEFHEGITCVVGPNGSGKSNISDAIRWVLGEQSPKMLRGGKMEEVIFAGTANRKSKGLAEVTLVIDNESGVLPIDYAEVAITRRMYRSGESEYCINQNPCRLKDIRELIMDTGIGVDGYSIIGQGKIAEIVGNKPEGRREIFEEAAGIVKYRSKKAESERKLEASNANLERVNDIIGEIEGRIDSLKEDSEKASEYLVLREKYQAIEINITLKNIENIELKNEYIKDDLIQIDDTIEEIKDQKTAIDTELSIKRNRNEELERLIAETQNQLLASVEEINRLKNRDQLNQEKLAAMERDRERLTEEIAAIESKLEKEDANARSLLENKSVMDRNLERLKEELREKNGRYAQLAAEADQAAQEAEAHKNRVFELHNTVNAKRLEENSLLNMTQTLERRQEQILADKSLADDAGSDVRTAYDGAVTAREEARERLAELSRQAEEAKAHYNQSVLEEKQLSGKLEELRVSIGQVSTRKKMIEEMENSYEGYNHAVKFVMQRGFSGINGVVAELIQVPAGFETAIETALGASMQNIICEEERSAQNVIAELKKNRAGRLTFLPLSGIRTSGVNRDSRISGAAGFKGFGVDCVEFEPKYRKAMEYLLGRVVIVDRLENAVKLSKTAGGGLRFVTLEGEVINAGGAITGGTLRSNTSNLLARRTEIQRLSDSLAELEAEKNRSVSRLAELRDAISAGQTDVRELEQRHRQQEMELLSRENEIRLCENQLSDQRSSQEKWERELANIEQERKSAEEMIREIRQAAEEARSQIVSEERLAEEAAVQVTARKRQVEEAGEEITKSRLEVGKVESEKNNLDQIAARIESDRKELTDEKAVKEETIAKLLAERNSMEHGGGNLTQLVQEKEEKRGELESNLILMQDEKGRLVRYLNEVQEKKESMDQVLLGHQNQKHELELKLAKNETQVDSYKDKLWDEFEVSYVQAIEFRKTDFALSSAVKESREIKSRIKELGEVNVGAIKEYETVRERYEFLSEQRADLLSAMDALKKIIDDMDRTIRINFKESFDKIVVNFEKAFSELFGGGTAELRLEDENRPLECGIDIVAQPPGKKLQNINLMSGGEKTMTAIALMFAVLKAKPTPFCILDEVEAALDEANIDRFAHYLQNFHEIQFALITHQKVTMEFADVLYGVTMPEQGVSKVISLRLGDNFEL